MGVESENPQTSSKAQAKDSSRTRQRSRPSRPRRFTVPNAVDPSWVHELAAAATVKVLRDRGLSVGDVSEDFLKSIPGAEDSPEPAVLLARIYAHVMYRIPLVRTFAKRLEGRERKAGLGSDSAALIVQLYLRNREQFATFRAEAARSMAQKRAEAERKTESGATAASVFQFRNRGGKTAASTPPRAAEGGR